MLFNVKWEHLKGAPNIIYLDDEGNPIAENVFEEELETGYRAAILIIPVANAIQLQVGMMTPYHRDHYEIDFGFVVENYNNFLRKSGDDDVLLDPEENEFHLGEIE